MNASSAASSFFDASQAWDNKVSFYGSQALPVDLCPNVKILDFQEKDQVESFSIRMVPLDQEKNPGRDSLEREQWEIPLPWPLGALARQDQEATETNIFFFRVWLVHFMTNQVKY